MARGTSSCGGDDESALLWRFFPLLLGGESGDSAMGGCGWRDFGGVTGKCDGGCVTGPCYLYCVVGVLVACLSRSVLGPFESAALKV